MIAHFGTLRHDPELAMALGEMTARWSYVEWLLYQLLKHLAELDWEKASAIMYAVTATSARIDIVRTVAERLPKSDARRARAVSALEKVVALCSRRNALVHHTWVEEWPDGKIWTFDYRAEPDTQARRKRQTAHSIKRFCDDIADCLQELSEAADARMPDEQIAAFKMPLTIKRPRTSAKG